MKNKRMIAGLGLLIFIAGIGGLFFPGTTEREKADRRCRRKGLGE